MLIRTEMYKTSTLWGWTFGSNLPNQGQTHQDSCSAPCSASVASAPRLASSIGSLELASLWCDFWGSTPERSTRTWAMCVFIFLRIRWLLLASGMGWLVGWRWAFICSFFSLWFHPSHWALFQSRHWGAPTPTVYRPVQRTEIVFWMNIKKYQDIIII